MSSPSDKSKTNEDSSEGWGFMDTAWAFLSPSGKDFVVKFDHLLQEGAKLADLADSLSEKEQLFVRIYMKNRAIKRIIDRERKEKIENLLERRQILKIRRAPTYMFATGSVVQFAEAHRNGA